MTRGWTDDMIRTGLKLLPSRFGWSVWELIVDTREETATWREAAWRPTRRLAARKLVRLRRYQP